MSDRPLPESSRRIDIQRLTPAEYAIRNAMIAVEEVGADPLLTDAVTLLQQARDKVADYVDGKPPTVTQHSDSLAQHAERVANTVQMITDCSDGTTKILALVLVELASEIKRQALEL